MGRVFIRPAYYLLARTRLFAVPSKRCVLSPRKSIRSLDDSHQFFFFQRNEHPCITCKLPYGNFFLFFSFFPPFLPSFFPPRRKFFGRRPILTFTRSVSMNMETLIKYFKIATHTWTDATCNIMCRVLSKKELDCNFKVKNS